jgi:hypothetical protein
MAMNFVSYRLCKLFLCLVCFQMMVVCINHFLQFTLTPFLLGPSKCVKEEFLRSFFMQGSATAF